MLLTLFYGNVLDFSGLSRALWQGKLTCSHTLTYITSQSGSPLQMPIRMVIWPSARPAHLPASADPVPNHMRFGPELSDGGWIVILNLECTFEEITFLRMLSKKWNRYHEENCKGANWIFLLLVKKDLTTGILILILVILFTPVPCEVLTNALNFNCYRSVI